jgi:integrase
MKGGQSHIVPLAPQAREIIVGLSRRAGTDFVFTTTGRTAVSGWSKAKTALDAAIAGLNGGCPLPDWRLHDLRRTIATGLQRSGVSLQCVEAVLGHVGGSRAGIAGVYQRHSFNAEKRAALTAWASHVMQIVTPPPPSTNPNRREFRKYRKWPADARSPAP